MLGLPTPASTTSTHFPRIGYLVFDAGQLDKITAKIQEFGGEAWTEKDQAALSSLATTLGATSRYSLSSYDVFVRVKTALPLSLPMPTVSPISIGGRRGEGFVLEKGGGEQQEEGGESPR